MPTQKHMQVLAREAPILHMCFVNLTGEPITVA